MAGPRIIPLSLKYFIASGVVGKFAPKNEDRRNRSDSEDFYRENYLLTFENIFDTIFM